MYFARVQRPASRRSCARPLSPSRSISFGVVERSISLQKRRHCLKTKYLLAAFVVAQSLLGMRVLWRILRSAGGERIQPEEAWKGMERISVIVPVLNERNRLSPCLAGLIAQGTEVAEIVVVDGGSDDGTQQLVCSYAGRDPRVRLLDASPI